MALNPTLLATIKDARNRYGRSDGKTVKFPEGRTKVRVLSGGNDVFFYDLGVHWVKTELNGKAVAAVGCHDIVHESHCPTCAALIEAQKEVERSGDDDQLKLIKEIKARRSVLVAGVIKDGKDASPTPQIIEFTATTFDKVLAVAMAFAEEDVDIFSDTEGMDLIVERRGKGLDTEYTVMAAPKTLALDPGVLKSMPDIPAFIEKEFFRSDVERKGLTAIGTVFDVHVSAPQLSTPGAARPMLTGSKIKAASDDADIIEDEPKKPAAAAIEAKSKKTPEPEPVGDEQDLDDLLKGLDLDDE